MNRGAWAAVVALSWAGLPVAAELDEDALADVVSNPSIGLYKGYAEFKMAHYGEARQIWFALAERGVAEAWFNLGILAEDGLGEPRDPALALARYRHGAEAGSVKAQYRLAQIYQEGRLVTADAAQARYWLARAAEAGDPEAAAQLKAQRSGVADPYLAARELEARGQPEEAAAAYRRLSATGDLRARTRLAWLLEAGRGIPRDLAEAGRLFRSAAEGGEAEAQYALAVMLETGVGQVRDPDEARRWLQRAAAAGNPEAQRVLKAHSH
ncbi:MAG: sel1 repeat family protein [Zoogloeaceae bacterium]|nr:sel1 repeat family protein [Zoogloeaceae bacterium]